MLTKKLLATVYGVVFLLVGLLGFLGSPELGLFNVDLLHNLVHVLTGLVGLFYGATSEANAAIYGKVFGVVYALVTILGFITVPDSGNLLGSVFAINAADNWLHLVLTLGFFVIGFVTFTKGDAMMGAKDTMSKKM
jgi:hypothetical protein